MVQMSSFYFKTTKKEDTEIILERLNPFRLDLNVTDLEIKSRHDYDFSFEKHQEIFKNLYTSDFDYDSLNEYYNDDCEYHEHVIVRNGHMHRFVQKDDYSGETSNIHYFDDEAFEEDSWDLEGEMCPECGEYIKKHPNFSFMYCPYCHHVEVLEVQETAISDAKWRTYDFEYPLGIEFNETMISQGQDWIGDCEEDSVFGLNPACFESQNQYNAALKLCRICDGWYRFESDEERQTQMECMRKVVKASTENPMWYFDVRQNSFNWLAALREHNEKYAGKLLDVEDLWTLFNRLTQRSLIEKAECFDWFVNFFGDALKYEDRYRMSDIYVQNYYDNHMEIILYLFPHQIEILTKSVAKISSTSMPALAKNAAGLIRMGKRELGLSLYKKVFAMVWTDPSSTVDEKKNVLDQFVERLSLGYENEQYIDEEIAKLLDKQCLKYSDGAWTSKIRTNLGRNKH